MMPKHVFEKQADPLAFKFNPPVSLGAYTLKRLRSQRRLVPVAAPRGLAAYHRWRKFGSPAPKFAMYIAPGPSDKKVIAQTQKDLDVIHDIAPEGMITLAKTNPTSKGWFKSFPWAHPDPTLPAVIFNNEKPGLKERDVRWALTLAIDIVRVAMASYRGAATISAIHVPPTGHVSQVLLRSARAVAEGLHPRRRRPAVQSLGSEAAAPHRRPKREKTLGDVVPTDPAEIRKSIGMGWWKYDVKTAEQLMLPRA